MKTIDVYNVVSVNEEGSVVGVKTFANIEDAKKEVENQHDTDRNMLESEGWEVEDNFFTPNGYTIYYGDFFYHAEIYRSDLNIPE